MVWSCAQETFHQHREPGPFGFIPYRHQQRFIDLWQQLARLRLAKKPQYLTHTFKRFISEGKEIYLDEMIDVLTRSSG
ncbi:hypothetical protein HZI30_24720 [Serratia fonticola]|uniref:hypothetical protein n=1 Tax=Serratia fonticola TaxID=47917 RepID=UPI0015C5B358|nr:hypothetical protein [Serratia fonticola]NXZ90128.1 hypothetical protein [Serratia fonticola]